MFNRLKQQLAELASSGRESLDPASFNDPIALQTEWRPAKGGGTNICTHVMKETSPDRIEFRATWKAKFFYSVFLFAGLGVIGAGVNEVATKEFEGGMLILFLVGAVFAMVGGLLLYFGTRRIVFDLQSGYYYRGSKSPQQVVNPDEIKTMVRLDRIHAIQLISERCSGNKGKRYYSYELNLVLDDAERMNVVDHGDPHRLRQDAAKLAALLGVPVWDAI